jgi:hypothetical protein
MVRCEPPFFDHPGVEDPDLKRHLLHRAKFG